MNWKKLSETIIIYMGLTIIISFAIIPVVWMFSCAFKPMSEIFASTPSIIWRILPRNPTLINFYEAFRLLDVPRYTYNSLIVALATALIGTGIATLTGYTVARKRFYGKKLYLWVLLMIQGFPSILFVIPLFIIYANIGLIDNYLGLTICYVAFSHTFAVWMMTGYIKTIPVEIEEAGVMDGATTPTLLSKILLPLIGPGMVSVAIYSFMTAWGDLLFWLTLTRSNDMKNLPIAIAMCSSQFTTEWGILMALSLLYTLPCMIFFSILQKYMVAGLTGGAIKG